MSVLGFPDGDAQVTVAILGSTGSVGLQALEVVRAHPERFKVTALAAGSDHAALRAQAGEFGVELIGLETPPEGSLDGLVAGPGAAAEIAERCDAQVVLNAVVGAAGLHATLATLKAGKILALANKESLVAAGELVMSRAGPGQIRPVDSEHSALWQALEGARADQVRKVLLTGSGGPFRGRKAGELSAVTPEEALAHPVWNMGPKISVDSATLMNKGLEVIEAHFLFGFTYDEIDVVIHPQGIFHALVELVDGSVLAHAAAPDMRLPVQVALGWPERLAAPGGASVRWRDLGGLSFEAPDTGTFRLLAVAYEAGRAGGISPAAMNAANEAAVRAFLDRRIGFMQVAEVVEAVLSGAAQGDPDLEGVLAADRWARERAGSIIAGMTKP